MRALLLRQSSESRMSRRYTAVVVVFGTSTPTVPLPGTGARMRTFSARMERAMLLDRAVIFSTFTPGAGYTSNNVTRGPLVTSPDSTGMPKSASVSRSTVALVFRSSITLRWASAGGSFSNVTDGNTYCSPAAAPPLASTPASTGAGPAFGFGAGLRSGGFSTGPTDLASSSRADGSARGATPDPAERSSIFGSGRRGNGSARAATASAAVSPPSLRASFWRRASSRSSLYSWAFNSRC
jgi:hypothetical protein